jgi:hypothetical protein
MAANPISFLTLEQIEQRLVGVDLVGLMEGAFAAFSSQEAVVPLPGELPSRIHQGKFISSTAISKAAIPTSSRSHPGFGTIRKRVSAAATGSCSCSRRTRENWLPCSTTEDG